ncbi:MAG TPA: Hpt domain-containing protein, partial [Humisphaera sp.]
MACAETAARQTVLSDADDLPGLAALHEALDGIRQTAAAADRSPEAVGQLAGTALGLVERIILREVADSAAAMEAMTRSVSELVALVGAATTDNPPPAPTPAGSSDFFVSDEPAAGSAGPAAPAPAAHVVPAESPVSAEDLPLVLEFCAEARGHLEAAEADLLRLETAPDDAESLNSIFRRFHTIKGVAGFLNVRQVAALAHEAENLLDLARKGMHRLAGASVDAVLDAVDVMKRLIDALQDAA